MRKNLSPGQCLLIGLLVSPPGEVFEEDVEK